MRLPSGSPVGPAVGAASIEAVAPPQGDRLNDGDDSQYGDGGDDQVGPESQVTAEDPFNPRAAASAFLCHRPIPSTDAIQESAELKTSKTP